MATEVTKNGVKVVEASEAAKFGKLTQADVQVVNQVVKNGRAEMRKKLAVPDKK